MRVTPEPGKPSPEMTDAARARDLRIARWLAVLMSFVLSGMGVFSVVTRFYYGRTTKLGGAENYLYGEPAVWMGVSTIFFGLSPLALWFRGKRSAVAWMLSCFALAAAAFWGVDLLTWESVRARQASLLSSEHPVGIIIAWLLLSAFGRLTLGVRMVVFRLGITAMFITALGACADAPTEHPASPSAQCSILTFEERAALKTAMASAVSESAELQNYMAFWDANSEKFRFEEPVTSGTFLWNGTTWAFQATTPTAVFLLGSVRTEVSGFFTFFDGITEHTVAANIEMRHDAQACQAFPECEIGDWTLSADVVTGGVSVTLADWSETVVWRYSVDVEDGLADIAFTAPGGEAHIITSLDDPYVDDTSYSMVFNGPAGPFKQMTVPYPLRHTFEYGGRALTVDESSGCEAYPDDLWAYFPYGPELLRISDLARLVGTYLEIHPLE